MKSILSVYWYNNRKVQRSRLSPARGQYHVYMLQRQPEDEARAEGVGYVGMAGKDIYCPSATFQLWKLSQLQMSKKTISPV